MWIQKNILILGAAGRIGLATSELVYKEGANLILSDINLEKLKLVTKNFDKKEKNKFYLLKSDITSEKKIKKLIKDSISILGKIDGVVYSAYPRSEQWGKPLKKISLEYLNQDLSMQLGSAIYFSKEILDYFKQNKGGSLIHISSIYGLRAPDFDLYKDTDINSPVEYSAIKSGIISICKWFAKYYANSNIRINCVSPGGIFDGHSKMFFNKYSEHCTNFGMISAEQVASTISFLLSEKSAAINGENIVIDDGWSL